MWHELFLFEILCVEWTQKWQSLIYSMFERWLEKVSYGYLTPSSGGDVQTSPDPRMLCFVPVSVWMMGAEAASSLLV